MPHNIVQSMNSSWFEITCYTWDFPKISLESLRSDQDTSDLEFSISPFEHVPNAWLSLHTTIITSQLNAENVYHSTHSIDREERQRERHERRTAWQKRGLHKQRGGQITAIDWRMSLRSTKAFGKMFASQNSHINLEAGFDQIVIYFIKKLAPIW